MKKALNPITKKQLQVYEYIVTENNWEYYVLDDKPFNDVRPCYVLSTKCSFEDVNIEGLKGSMRLRKRVTASTMTMPPIGFNWVTENKFTRIRN